MRFQLAPYDLPADYAEQILSLADAKDHLRVLHSDQDGLIELYRNAAVDMVERYCGVYLGERTGVVWNGESLPATIDLGFWPVTNITGLTYLDSDGESVTGDHSDWRIGVHDRIHLNPGADLPSDVCAGVAITFDAGFTDANRPPALVQAIKFFLAHLFLNAEAVSAGAIGGEVPLGFRAMCAQYRMPVI